jgi:hypothetical protein
MPLALLLKKSAQSNHAIKYRFSGEAVARSKE